MLQHYLGRLTVLLGFGFFLAGTYPNKLGCLITMPNGLVTLATAPLLVAPPVAVSSSSLIFIC